MNSSNWTAIVKSEMRYGPLWKNCLGYVDERFLNLNYENASPAAVEPIHFECDMLKAYTSARSSGPWRSRRTELVDLAVHMTNEPPILHRQCPSMDPSKSRSSSFSFARDIGQLKQSNPQGAIILGNPFFSFCLVIGKYDVWFCIFPLAVLLNIFIKKYICRFSTRIVPEKNGSTP